MSPLIQVYHYTKIVHRHNKAAAKNSSRFTRRNKEYDEKLGMWEISQKESIIQLALKRNMFGRLGSTVVAMQTAEKAKRDGYIDYVGERVVTTEKGDTLISGGVFKLGLLSALYNRWDGAVKLLALFVSFSLGTLLYKGILVLFHSAVHVIR